MQTPDGPRAIETLRPGDRILVRDAAEPTQRYGSVVSVHQSSAPRTLRLRIDGEVIVTTEGHPFWKPGSGWVRAGDLGQRDRVLGKAGPVAIEAIEPGEAETVWNLVVDNGSGFFVGRLGIFVHDFSPIADAGAVLAAER